MTQLLLNRFSKTITQNKSQGASQSMLYALNLTEQDLKKPQIGIGSNWFEGNPCNNHLDKLSTIVSKSVKAANLIPFRYNTIGVSDGITNGTIGGSYSLPSREHIADSYEMMNIAHSYDGNIAIPGCDKNLPGCLIGMIRIDRPSFMIYGGSISPGKHNGCNIDIVDAFQSFGKYECGEITDTERKSIVQKACPGSGSCGGMYTANTMAAAIESMGFMLPYSSSNPALSNEKFEECSMSGKILHNLLLNDIKPSDIINKASIQNAIVTAMALGGSTNMVLHILAICKTANIDFNIDNFNSIGATVPVIANLKPHGKYLMNDLHKIGGVPLVQKLLLTKGLLNGDCLTITGKTLSENLIDVDLNKLESQNIIDYQNPIKNDSHIKILKGNLSPYGCVAKITGKEGTKFKGTAIVFDSENAFMEGLESGRIKEGHVIIIRYQGPKGGPGMPEMLKPTSAIVGYGLHKNVAFITDGRFSGGSHGFIIGHVTPEAIDDGPIAHVQDGDIINIDSDNGTIEWDSLGIMFNGIESLDIKFNGIESNNFPKKSLLKKYIKLVSPAHLGCTHD